jgi:hypothetical protein
MRHQRNKKRIRKDCMKNMVADDEPDEKKEVKFSL